MNIAFDADIFCRQTQGGISLHFTCLIDQLVKQGHVVLIFCPSRKRSKFNQNIHISSLSETGRFKVYCYDHIFDLHRLCLFYGVNVFHFTYYSLRPPLWDVPTVRTFHDIAFLRYPFNINFFQALLRLVFQLFSFMSCRGVTCVSNFSCSEFNSVFRRVRVLLRLPRQPVTIVNNSSGLEAFTSSSNSSSVDTPALHRREFVIMYVGLRGGYKNFRNGFHALLISANRLHSQNPRLNIRLRLVGQNALHDSDIKSLKAAGVHLEFLRNVDSHSLAEFYSSSDLLLHTSVYEGFGITVLEAMQCCCPVLAVDIPSVREVALNTIFYAPDGSVDSISNSLISILSSPSEAYSLVQAAANRSKFYSWEKSASSLVRFYHELIDPVRAK